MFARSIGEQCITGGLGGLWAQRPTRLKPGTWAPSMFPAIDLTTEWVEQASHGPMLANRPERFSMFPAIDLTTEWGERASNGLRGRRRHGPSGRAPPVRRPTTRLKRVAGIFRSPGGTAGVPPGLHPIER